MGCLCGDDRQSSRQGLVSYEIIHVAALLPPENPTKVAQRQGIPNHHSGFNTTGSGNLPQSFASFWTDRDPFLSGVGSGAGARTYSSWTPGRVSAAAWLVILLSAALLTLLSDIPTTGTLRLTVFLGAVRIKVLGNRRDVRELEADVGRCSHLEYRYAKKHCLDRQTDTGTLASFHTFLLSSCRVT